MGIGVPVTRYKSFISKFRESVLLYTLIKNRRFMLGLAMFLVLLLMGLVGPLLYPRDPLAFAAYPPDLPPSPEFPLGTDRGGRDVFAQFLHGIRMSLYVGFLTAVISTVIGLVIGVTAGIKGGVLDETLMGLTNLVLAIPSWLVALLIASITPAEHRGPEFMGLILGIFSWPWFARAVRAQFQSLREREFVALSRMAGYGDLRIAFEDLLPQIGAFIVSSFAGLMATGIGGEAGLAIIGVGMTRHISLGMILFWAGTYQAYITGAWWLFLPAGIAMIILMVSLQMVSVGLEQLFNPRLREG
ncbi:MAG: ABC transporter permease [Ignisphaera sp.]